MREDSNPHGLVPIERKIAQENFLGIMLAGKFQNTLLLLYTYGQRAM
jgi:hypothetical protein